MTAKELEKLGFQSINERQRLFTHPDLKYKTITTPTEYTVRSLLCVFYEEYNKTYKLKNNVENV